MGTMTVEVTTRMSGPLMEGRGPEIIAKMLRAAAKDLAETGRDWIRLDAEAMDRSGRGGTGRAAAGVELSARPPGYVISGAAREGDVWWPWLEGVSRRNATTKFKGYHTFRKNAGRLNRVAADILEKHVREHIGELGGTP